MWLLFSCRLPSERRFQLDEIFGRARLGRLGTILRRCTKLFAQGAVFQTKEFERIGLFAPFLSFQIKDCLCAMLAGVEATHCRGPAGASCLADFLHDRYLQLLNSCRRIQGSTPTKLNQYQHFASKKYMQRAVCTISDDGYLTFRGGKVAGILVNDGRRMPTYLINREATIVYSGLSTARKATPAAVRR